VSVPRHLRGHVNPILRENRNKLLTPFDIYASFIDILNEPHLQAPTGPQGHKGVSFFRPLPPGECMHKNAYIHNVCYCIFSSYEAVRL
ncbi:hypothetical protein PENTCL1PPCAC_25112, partial [Pristionchus entomophagus]